MSATGVWSQDPAVTFAWSCVCKMGVKLRGCQCVGFWSPGEGKSVEPGILTPEPPHFLHAGIGRECAMNIEDAGTRADGQGQFSVFPSLHADVVVAMMVVGCKLFFRAFVPD